MTHTATSLGKTFKKTLTLNHKQINYSKKKKTHTLSIISKSITNKVVPPQSTWMLINGFPIILNCNYYYDLQLVL